MIETPPVERDAKEPHPFEFANHIDREVVLLSRADASLPANLGEDVARLVAQSSASDLAPEALNDRSSAFPPFGEQHGLEFREPAQRSQCPMRIDSTENLAFESQPTRSDGSFPRSRMRPATVIVCKNSLARAMNSCVGWPRRGRAASAARISFLVLAINSHGEPGAARREIACRVARVGAMRRPAATCGVADPTWWAGHLRRARRDGPHGIAVPPANASAHRDLGAGYERESGLALAIEPEPILATSVAEAPSACTAFERCMCARDEAKAVLQPKPAAR